MEKEDFIELAEKIRDGKATDQERSYFLEVCNFELGEVSKILKQAKGRREENKNK